MILGLSLGSFTLAHVMISLLAIAAGLLCCAQLIRGRLASTWTGLFLTTTIATSVTGFFFHSTFGPPHVIGILSLLLLALALYAWLGRRLTGRWRLVYVVTAMAALYLNIFVAVVQAFQKIGVLHAYAPNGSEPPFAVAQGVILLLFVAVGYQAARRFGMARSSGTRLE